MAKPAARKTDPSSCPLPGHGTNPIATGSPDVFFDGLSAARQGDTCTCGSALSSGLSSTVFINGKNPATIDTGGTHGSVVIGGSGTVIIGDSHTACPFFPPVPLVLGASWIGFKIPATEVTKVYRARRILRTDQPFQAYLTGTTLLNLIAPQGKFV